jgi:hypothetical protein
MGSLTDANVPQPQQPRILGLHTDRATLCMCATSVLRLRHFSSPVADWLTQHQCVATVLTELEGAVVSLLQLWITLGLAMSCKCVVAGMPGMCTITRPAW